MVEIEEDGRSSVLKGSAMHSGGIRHFKTRAKTAFEKCGKHLTLITIDFVKDFVMKQIPH